MSRVRELSFRVANAALISALGWLHRRFDVATTYKLGPRGAAALFEDAWFAYRPREYGCTGNIDWAPDAENSTRQAVFDRANDGQVFYDIGAHGGVYTITLTRRFPNLKVHSFEPQPEDLLDNLALNELPTANVHAVAVGDHSGTVLMTTKERSSNHVSDKGDRAVRLVRLDDYVAEMNLPAPDWIKIDIEGLELQALRGAEGLLRKSKPTVICEINHLHGRFGTSVTGLLGFMRGLGYEVHRLNGGGLEPLPQANSFEMLGYSANWNFWFVHEDDEATSSSSRGARSHTPPVST
jgi:FkbM family methyltransferase